MDPVRGVEADPIVRFYETSSALAARPRAARGDVFYRMGQGEDYIHAWHKWRKALSPLALAHYDSYYPAPGWRDS
jgi:hypothetical protein